MDIEIRKGKKRLTQKKKKIIQKSFSIVDSVLNFIVWSLISFNSEIWLPAQQDLSVFISILREREFVSLGLD